jgi:hypothetical protein
MSEADDELDSAVRAVVNQLRQTSDNEDTGVITEWAAVVHTSSFDDDGHPTSAYYLLFSGGTLADHRAVGLFDHGIHMVRDGESVSER